MADVSNTTSRDDVLTLLSGGRPERVPAFSGLISVTAPGLDSLGLRFSEVHQDATKMAQAAASSYRLFGLGSVVVPLDICVEAGALGAQVDFRADVEVPAYPVVETPIAASPGELRVPPPSDVVTRGRIPLVIDALSQLTDEIGGEAAIGAWVPGPFTLAMYLVEPRGLVLSVKEAPEALGRALDALADVLGAVGTAYVDAGADFVTVHEMGGSPGYLGPRTFETLILPRLKRLMAELPPPRVLSVCGNTNRAMPMLAQAGAEALSVDQLNNLAQSRETLGPEVLLFGNVDPVAVLANGSAEDVTRTVEAAIQAGADAIWPGCDLWPVVSPENMRALVEAAQRASRT